MSENHKRTVHRSLYASAAAAAILSFAFCEWAIRRSPEPSPWWGWAQLLIYALMGITFWTFLWKAWRRLRPYEGSLHPAKALLFYLVPLLSFYGVFVAVRGLARHLNAALSTERKWYFRTREGLAWLICVTHVIGQAVGVIIAVYLLAAVIVAAGNHHGDFGAGEGYSYLVLIVVPFFKILCFLRWVILLFFFWENATAIEALDGLRVVPAEEDDSSRPREPRGHAIEASNIHKTYKMGRTSLHVLKDVSLKVKEGQFAAIIGASGSGKSTLLHLVGLLDRPDKDASAKDSRLHRVLRALRLLRRREKGIIRLNETDASLLSSAKRNRVRCRNVGFVFQFYHLLPELSVFENVLLPMMVNCSVFRWSGRRRRCYQKTGELLELVGLAGRTEHRPKELSGGERQRVAIARALINEPEILLADEPTGNLDSRTGKQIMDVLLKTNREQGQTILMVTHDQSLASQAHQVMHLQDGKMVTP